MSDNGELIKELRGVIAVLGSMSPLGNLAHRAAEALSHAAAPETPEPFDPYLTPGEVEHLPVGSVVMTETDPEVFGVYEQRVWQRFGGEPDWYFKRPRHEWQSTDGGFQRVEDRDSPPVFSHNRRVRLLYAPGPLPAGGETDDE